MKNMNTNKLIRNISTLALVAVVGIMVTGSAYAYQGDYTKKGPNYTPERHTAMEKAFNNNDYNAWKKLMQGKGRVTQVITKDNFAKFAQAHKLGLTGKIEEANKIKDELGLGLHNGSGMGQGVNQNRRNK